MINNTGLTVATGSWSYINPSNLSFTTNADDSGDVDIVFNVTKTPQYGNIQRLRIGSKWQNVLQFTQKQMVVDRLRYIHLSTGPQGHADSFHFTACVNDFCSDVIYEFRIQIVSVQFQVN